MKQGVKKAPRPQAKEAHELSGLALRACSIAADAAFNVRDFLVDASQMAFLAARDCEKELDRIEQDIDEQLPSAITEVDELEARELLAASRFSSELERIGDLLLGAGKLLRNLRNPLSRSDKRQLIAMINILQEMLHQLKHAYEFRALDGARYVLGADRDIDRLYKGFLLRRAEIDEGEEMQQIIDVLLIAQVLERAGDHATNLAEELFRLVEGRSLRHVPKRERKD
jgi:phosphate transport system protein